MIHSILARCSSHTVLAGVLFAASLFLSNPASAESVIGKEGCAVSGAAQASSSGCPDSAITWTIPTASDYVSVRSEYGNAAYPVDVPFDAYDLSKLACRYIDNVDASLTHEYFVPFRSPEEWNAFINMEHNYLALLTCARPRSYTITPSAACIAAAIADMTTVSPASFTVNLPYERTGNPAKEYTFVFKCGNSLMDVVDATYTPDVATDGAVSPETSGWIEAIERHTGSCGTADGTGSATEPTSGLCAGNDVYASGVTLANSEWTWTCSASGTSSSSSVSCSAPYSAIPKCGAANNVAVSSAPSTDLCEEGTASAVSGLGPWNWTCTSGTSTESCSAPLDSIPECGTADGVPATSAPTADLCTGGTPSAVTGTGPWAWECTSGSTSESCSAPTEAMCGTANGVAVTSAPTSGLCEYGTASAISGSGPWTWSCTSGTSNVTCNAPTSGSASCGSAADTVTETAPTANLCSVGTPSAVMYISNASPLAQWYFQWTCTGGSDTVTCIAPKCACAMCGLASGVPSSTPPSSGLCGYGVLKVPPGVFLNGASEWKWYCVDEPSASSHNCYAPKE
ncbi:MAG: hypothetical protein PHE27_00820 [Alphaproteobacteria bacterium]|nr:hypothetical protein [Alphaproteobacteria bacterium]